ncbi:hypothetical protein QT972_06375 [Microcoleus sp. herbarium7]|uniref:hypothetical protein n=1 Tax=Microcoleus sp. herbarium7 TaxID=3055435 RepID=UPI002FD38F15
MAPEADLKAFLYNLSDFSAVNFTLKKETIALWFGSSCTQSECYDLTIKMGNLRFKSSGNRYRWIALGSFAVIMGISGALAYRLAPPPGFLAQGTLTSNSPPVKFSSTGTTILKQGEQLTPDVLLADNVVKAVADAVKLSPQQVRQNAFLKISKPEQPLEIAVGYRSIDREQAIQTADMLMKGMVEKSRLINRYRWQSVNQSLNQRLAQVTQDLKQAQQKLDQYERERARLLQQMKLQQDFYNKTQLAMADTQASEKEMVSSFAPAQVPQIVATPTSDPTVPLILGVGLLLAILVSRGLIPSVADWQHKTAFEREESERLQSALYRLIKEGSGEITLVRFAMETRLSPEVAQRFLNEQAEVFNANCEIKDDGSILYHFHI